MEKKRHGGVRQQVSPVERAVHLAAKEQGAAYHSLYEGEERRHACGQQGQFFVQDPARMDSGEREPDNDGSARDSWSGCSMLAQPCGRVRYCLGEEEVEGYPCNAP